MRSITRLFGAVGTLTDSLLSLAGVIDATAAKLRMQLVSEIEAPALANNAGALDEPEDNASPSAKRGRKT